MPTRCVSARPAPFDCSCLAHLYAQYRSVFIGEIGFQRSVVSACGMTVVLMDRHFFHLAGLRRQSEPDAKLHIQEELPRIVATTAGFGDYALELRRARHLSSALDCILNPDAVFEAVPRVDAQFAFFKHYGDRPTPVMQVMIGHNEAGELIPKTAFPVRLRQAKTRYADYKPVWHVLEQVA